MSEPEKQGFVMFSFIVSTVFFCLSVTTSVVFLQTYAQLTYRQTAFSCKTEKQKKEGHGTNISFDSVFAKWFLLFLFCFQHNKQGTLVVRTKHSRLLPT